MVTRTADNTIRFSLLPFIYAARFEQSIIILNSNTDQYISLIGDAARYFEYVLLHSFIKTENDAFEAVSLDQQDEHISPENLTSWITYFKENGFISLGEKSTKIPSPAKSGGLIDYAWNTKHSWHPFAQASTVTIVEAFFMLKWVHTSMKKNGVKEIFECIAKSNSSKPLTDPSEAHIKKLSAAVDAASLLYWKTTACFAWATTYTLLALKRGWNVRVAIGVQTDPFYAHAWAESKNCPVINDDPKIAQVLSIIYRTHFSTTDKQDT